MNQATAIESILFVAGKPLSARDIAKSLQIEEDEVKEIMEQLKQKYNHDESGIHILDTGVAYQMGTNPQCIDAVSQFTKYEMSGELTKAQLETLTVIAYCAPITRPEIEQIRGVNCSVILRTLLMRGYIEEGDHPESLMPAYTLSTNALAQLGISDVKELPEYETLHAHANIVQTLQEDENTDQLK